MKGPQLGCVRQEITWPDQVAPRGRKASSILDLNPQTSNCSGQWTSCNTLPHCLGTVGSGPPAVHCFTAWGQVVVDLLQYNASLPGGSGQ